MAKNLIFHTSISALPFYSRALLLLDEFAFLGKLNRFYYSCGDFGMRRSSCLILHPSPMHSRPFLQITCQGGIVVWPSHIMTVCSTCRRNRLIFLFNVIAICRRKPCIDSWTPSLAAIICYICNNAVNKCFCRLGPYALCSVLTSSLTSTFFVIFLVVFLQLRQRFRTIFDRCK